MTGVKHSASAVSTTELAACMQGRTIQQTNTFLGNGSAEQIVGLQNSRMQGSGIPISKMRLHFSCFFGSRVVRTHKLQRLLYFLQPQSAPNLLEFFKG
jgi:hypothetical protein